MECFDRAGERAKLAAAVDSGAGLSLVTGSSGIGKSRIISSVLDKVFQRDTVLKYEFGRAPLPLLRLILTLCRAQSARHTQVLTPLESLAIGEVTVSIPFIGKAPVRWKSNELQTSVNNLRYSDIILAIDSPVLTKQHKLSKKISRYLNDKKFNCLWISNCELASPVEFAEVCTLILHASAQIPIIVESATFCEPEEAVDRTLLSLAQARAIPVCHLDVKPFNSRFARSFFDYLELGSKGLVFDHKRSAGVPAAIKFDLSVALSKRSVSRQIQACLDHSPDSAATLRFLTLFFSTENRYERLIELAGGFGVSLSIEKLVETGLVKLSETQCELAHPRIAQFMALTQRQAIYELLRARFASGRAYELEVDLAALGMMRALDIDDARRLSERGIAYVFKALKANELSQADTILSLVEAGISDTELAFSERDCTPIASVLQLLRQQVDTLMGLHAGMLPNAASTATVGLLIAAQARMRQIDLKSAIALTEAAEARLESISSQGLRNWLQYCALYIRASCQIAAGEFDHFDATRAHLDQASANVNTNARRLAALLPGRPPEPETLEKLAEKQLDFIGARLANNAACDRLFVDCTDSRIITLLSKSLERVHQEGSIETTFPLNNLAIAHLYSGKPGLAIDLLYEAMGLSVYPYDNFASQMNLSAALAYTGQPEEALEWMQRAQSYIETGELRDPVFVLKARFNRAVLAAANGDLRDWQALPKTGLADLSLPRDYPDIFAKKVALAGPPAQFADRARLIGTGNIETAGLLWPQNLTFWDFMYPVVTSEYIVEMIRS